MKTTSIATRFVALLLTAVAATAWADDKSIVNAADTKFIKETGASGLAEVKIATLGSEKATRADVKDFAAMLVADHTALNAELTALAQSKKVDLSAVINPDAATTFQDLERESGNDFDKAFLNHMEKAHKSSIDNFEEAGKDAVDGDLKAWANQTLPKLRAHLDKIKELQAK